MKKLAAGVVVVGAAMIAAVALAWNVQTNLPTKAGDVVNAGGKVAVQTALNKKLESNKCAFKGPTADTTCDLGKVGKELAAAYAGIKEGAKYSVYVNIEADDAAAAGKKAKGGMSGYDRASKVSEKLQGSLAAAALTDSWHYSTKSSNSKGNNLKISVEVK